MDPVYDLPQHLDSTMLSAFRSCAQKYYREFAQGLRSAELSVDLHAGACFSATLERYYQELFLNGASTTEALGRAYATFSHEWGDFTPLDPKHPKTSDNMWAAVEDYLRVYPARSDRVQPYFSSGVPTFEFSFAIPLDFPGFPRHPTSGDPFIYTGRFDMFGLLDGTRPVVRDEKTSRRLDSNWADLWNLRSQFLGYCWALQHNGIPCDTVVVRGVIITTKEVRQIEAIKTYSASLIAKWFEQLRLDLHRIVACHERGWWDYNLGESCTAYSKTCMFADLCQSPTPENWLSTFNVRRWNPLSRNPISDKPSSISLKFSEKGNIPDKFQYMPRT